MKGLLLEGETFDVSPYCIQLGLQIDYYCRNTQHKNRQTLVRPLTSPTAVYTASSSGMMLHTLIVINITCNTLPQWEITYGCFSFSEGDTCF